MTTDLLHLLNIYTYIILYANFFDNSAISLVNVDVVFSLTFLNPAHQSRGWYCKDIPHPAIPPSTIPLSAIPPSEGHSV